MSTIKKQQLEKESLLTANEVKKLLHYDPETGFFTWLCDPFTGPRRKGTIAGVIGSFGYRSIKIAQIKYMAHRLAWLVTYGSWPIFDVDHINGRQDDNRIENLRVATKQQNNCNMKAPSTNKSGAKNVHWHKDSNRWRVQIKNKGQSIHIGYFDDFELASFVASEARLKYHAEFARNF